jgi:hypothetical protein
MSGYILLLTTRDGREHLYTSLGQVQVFAHRHEAEIHADTLRTNPLYLSVAVHYCD